MTEAKWERAAGIGGVLFVVLVLVSAFLPGSPPATNDSAREIAKFFADKADEIRWSSFLAILATIPLVWWVSALYRMLERATGSARLGIIAAVGVAIGTVAASVSAVLTAVVAIVGVEGSGGVAGTRFFYIFATNLNGLVAIGTALLVGATSAGILRTAVLPKALGWFGALVALLALVASLISVSTRDAVMAFTFVTFLAFALWAVIVSVLMFRRPVEDSPATTP